MTEQEAIKYLKGGCLGLNCEYHIKDRCKDDYEVREKKKDDAINLSIKALEKQIAKKPHREYIDAGNFKLVSCSCGVCEAPIIMRLPKPIAYCNECGQKLDWGNEDAE